MPCFEEIVDAPEIGDPGDDPSPPTSQVFIEDEVVTDKVTGGQSIVFHVGVYPIRFAGSLSVNWATANGTAIAGTHYTAGSGTLTIPAGDSEGLIEVLVDGNFTNINPKRFVVNLTVPVNCTIDDAQATGTISYDGTAGRDPTKRHQYQSISRSNRQILDQYAVCSTRNQCTAFAMGSFMSVAEVIEAGIKRKFKASELFTGSGGTPCTSAQCANHNCASWYDTKVQSYTKSTGIRRLNESGGDTGLFRKINNIQEITSSPSIRAGSASVNKQAYIDRIKRAIVKYHAVYVSSVWYIDWNSASVNKNHQIMSKQSGWPDTDMGHSYILVGWNDDYAHGGSFIVQNSLGTRWGSGGWGYLPYQHLKDSWTGSAFKRKDNNTAGTPWFRVFSFQYKGS